MTRRGSAGSPGVAATRSFALALVIVLGTAACGTTRSVEAYCTTMGEYREVYLATFDAANASFEDGDPLSGVLQAGDALQQLSRMWHDLADVAPEEIRGDVETVRDAYDDQLDAVAEGDLSGAAWAGVAAAVFAGGSIERIDQYTITHCPEWG